MVDTKSLVARSGNLVHRTLFRLSNGRVGGNMLGMPVVELTTTGRKSGAPRTVMLTSPLQEHGKIVLVASFGGDDHHPAWFLNLREHPEVHVVTGGESRDMHARVASPEERADMWPRITEKHKNYAGYQTKTTREIPLVILEASGS